MDLDPTFPDTNLRAAAWVDQVSTLPEEDAACKVHHWLIDTPAPGIRDLGAVCKVCGAERTYDALPEEQLTGFSEQWRDLTTHKRAREVWSDYLTRLADAETLAGVRHAAK